MATSTNEVDEIRRQMAQIRRELHQDVRDVVASAEAVTDWHRYIRKYPWVALGAAAAAGYLIVPRRHPSLPPHPATQADVSRLRAAVEAQAEEKAESKREKRKGLIGMALGFLGPIALRAAQGYAVSYLENWIVQQQMTPAGPPPGGQPGAARGPNRPGGLG